MKLKHKILIGAFVVACLCLLVHTCRVGSQVNYHKGRADQALSDLAVAEKNFTELKKQDKALQEKKDEEIAELKKATAKKEVVIVVKEKEIVVTRDMLIASGLYKGLVKELDEKWASKYTTLEGIVADKDKVIKSWEEKFDSKVELEVKGWMEKDRRSKEAIKRLKTSLASTERALKRSKFWSFIGKGFTYYHTVKGGINLAKEIF